MSNSRRVPTAGQLALLLLLWASLLQPLPAAPPDWAEALAADPRLAPQVRWLEVGDGRALALYQPQRGAALRGSVVLLHDQRNHADWPRVIGPLRAQLPEYGWETWSLQLPTWEADADAYLQQSDARIRAVLSTIAEQGDQPIVLLGAGTGAVVALQFQARSPKSPLRALVAVSLRPMPEQTLDTLRTLVAGVEIPVLEVFAERDLRAVLRGVKQRQSLAARPTADLDAYPRKPARYRQMLIEGADAEFSNQTDTLTKRIRGWLRVHTER